MKFKKYKIPSFLCSTYGYGRHVIILFVVVVVVFLFVEMFIKKEEG